MPGYLHHLASRLAGSAPVVQPRLPSRFEPIRKVSVSGTQGPASEILDESSATTLSSGRKPSFPSENSGQLSFDNVVEPPRAYSRQVSPAQKRESPPAGVAVPELTSYASKSGARAVWTRRRQFFSPVDESGAKASVVPDPLSFGSKESNSGKVPELSPQSSTPSSPGIPVNRITQITRHVFERELLADS